MKLAILVGSVISMAILAACSSGDSQGKATASQPTPIPTASAPTATPTPTPTPSPTPTPTPTATPIPPPIASFTIDASSGSAPFTVGFTDTSDGRVTAWDWDFGDGDDGVGRSVTHQYKKAGTLTARLTVTGPGGNNSIAHTVSITPGTPARLTIDPAEAAVQVQGSSTFTAATEDIFGNAVNAPVTWSIVSGGGSVDASGAFTAGTAAGLFPNTIRARVQGETGPVGASASVTVHQGPPSRMTISPAQATLGIGATRQFTADVTDQFGNAITNGLMSWSVLEGVGTITGEGRFTAGTKAGAFPGAIRVDVVEGSDRASATVNVSIPPDPLATIGVLPSFTVVEERAGKKFTAQGFDQYGNEIPGLAFLWEATGGEITREGFLTTGGQVGRYEVRASASFRGSAATGSATVQLPRTIRFADNQFGGSLHVLTGIAKFVAENGFGHSTEVIEVTTPAYQTSLASGETHVQMEGWEQNLPDWYDRETAAGNILNYGEVFEGGPQFFVIPQWVHEQYGINTVQDVVDNWELFKDPEDSSRGIFYNCIIGWQCTELNNVKLQAYGLVEQYNIVSPGSAAALKASLASAQERNEPVFGYYWSPTDLMGLYDWHILEEPAYNDADWATISAAANDVSLRPVDQGVAYETLPINKLVHKSLPEIAPEFSDFLRQMSAGLAPLQKTLGWLDSNAVADHIGLGAFHFMRNNTELVKSWMDADTWERVRVALAQEPPTN